MDSEQDQRTLAVEPDPPGPARADVEYLDLDRDGIPDAVQATNCAEYRRPDGISVFQTTRELDAGIGDDGCPKSITWSNTVSVHGDQRRPEGRVVVALELRPKGC
jgi:hypothetical protein